MLFVSHAHCLVLFQLIHIVVCSAVAPLKYAAFYTSSVSTKHHVIGGTNVIHKDSLIRSASECAVGCLSTSGCKGFNYKRDESMCELLGTNYMLQPKLLEPRTGYIHYWNDDETNNVDEPYSDLIIWPLGCDQYAPRYDSFLNTDSVYSDQHESPSVCRSLCTNRTDCGGYTVNNGLCMLVNINDEIITEHLNDTWFLPLAGCTFYSKTCPYDVSHSDVKCNVYEAASENDNNKMIMDRSRWLMYTASQPKIPSLVASDCQRWCTLYAGCRSVKYQSYPSGGDCFLYTTTIQELMDTGQDGAVAEDAGVETFDRYCPDGRLYTPAGP